MSTKIAQRFLSAAAMAACLLVSTASQAIVYFGSWDPQYNGTYSGTGFRGDVSFFVPDACLSESGLVSDGALCSGGGMYLISATVELYDFNNPATVLSTITFAPPVQSPDPVVGVEVQLGKVVGLETDLIGPEPSGVDSETAPALLFLEFRTGLVGDISAGAYLVGATCDLEFGCSESDATGARSNPGDVTFTTPEPGSLALILAALSAGWFLRRRVLPA